MNYIILVGAFQALISFALSFVHKKGASGNTLSWLFALIFLHLGGNFFINIAFPQSETHKQFNTFIALFYGPVLWMYVAPLTGATLRNRWYYYVHMLPGAIAATVYFSIAAYTVAHGGKTPPAIYYYNLITGYAIVLSLACYSICCWLYARHITVFWEEERQLVKLVAGLFCSISLVWFSFQIISLLSPALLPMADVFYGLRIFVYLVLLTICLGIVRVKFSVIKYTNTVVSAVPVQQAAAEPEAVLLSDDGVEAVSEERDLAQKRQVLPAEQHAVIAGEIHKMMEEKQLFTDAALTLDSLAAAMKVSRNHLSEVLNQHIGRSFYQYINEYRIRYVVHLMDRCKKEQVAPNILSLAFDAGFHTKSSFNQYFKKVMGCTPSAYMKAEAEIFHFSVGELPLSEA